MPVGVSSLEPTVFAQLLLRNKGSSTFLFGQLRLADTESLKSLLQNDEDNMQRATLFCLAALFFCLHICLLSYLFKQGRNFSNKVVIDYKKQQEKRHSVDQADANEQNNHNAGEAKEHDEEVHDDDWVDAGFVDQDDDIDHDVYDVDFEDTLFDEQGVFDQHGEDPYAEF
ncbi:hypothetical protein PoB_002833500 [Plakobranchus ocellatus]|uniref:Uncharacterized protein n=1 Tax=Plakobranchus ocellatus TaxID=259542 RepID=A0AAV4A4P0_9GAST|nr:hypothetical protein PoB_002833500 [Plakobranchus ocellatus]